MGNSGKFMSFKEMQELTYDPLAGEKEYKSENVLILIICTPAIRDGP